MTTRNFSATSLFTQYLDRGATYSTTTAAQGTRYQAAQSNPQQKLVGVIRIPSLADVDWTKQTISNVVLTHASVYSYTGTFRLYRAKLNSTDRTKKGSDYLDTSTHTDIDAGSNMSIDEHTATLSATNRAWLENSLKAGYVCFCVYWSENAPTTDKSFSEHYAAASTWEFTITYELAASTLNTVSNGTIEGTTTATWTNYSSSFTRKIKFSLGSASSGEISVTGTSYTYTIPASWYNQIPNATSAAATCILYTYNGSTLLGTSTKTFTVSVGSSVVPTISATASKVNTNSTVNGWGIYLQSYSKVAFSVSASAGTGASIASYTITGHSISISQNTSATSTTATSGTLTESGTKTYTLKVTDSRGRSASMTLSISVVAYELPSIMSADAYRSDSTGSSDAVTGTYLNSVMRYSYASVSGHNTISTKIEYKPSTSTTWATAATNIGSGVYTGAFGGGNIDVSLVYNVRFTATDALNNKSVLTVEVQSVLGFSVGLKNDRARFGGVVKQAGLEVDWDSQFHGSILTALGDISQTGRFVQHNPSAVSVPTSTWTNVAQLALTEGVWLLFYTAAFSANSAGRRQSIIATAADSTSPINYMVRDSENAVVDAMTYLDSIDVRTVESGGATYYLNVWHNAGTALSTIGRLYAIRIC